MNIKHTDYSSTGEWMITCNQLTFVVQLPFVFLSILVVLLTCETVHLLLSCSRSAISIFLTLSAIVDVPYILALPLVSMNRNMHCVVLRSSHSSTHLCICSFNGGSCADGVLIGMPFSFSYYMYIISSGTCYMDIGRTDLMIVILSLLEYGLTFSTEQNT